LAGENGTDLRKMADQIKGKERIYEQQTGRFTGGLPTLGGGKEFFVQLSAMP
jgi:hypothetical protein